MTIKITFSAKAKKILSILLKYVILLGVGFLMIYPLIWMIGASFKNNTEIFTSAGFIPEKVTFDGYISAFTKNYGGNITLIKSLLNTYSYVIPRVLFTVISCTMTAYAFERFEFASKKFLFSILMSTLFLPQCVLNVPQFIVFSKLGWVDSPAYLPLIVPCMLAIDTYFVYLLIQFMRGVPRELDEAAKIDGCNSFQILTRILCPVIKPAMVSVALFQFMWSSNDYMGPLLYVNTPAKYPATIFVKLAMDADSGFDWNRVLAISIISIIPALIVFFAAQKQFVDGIASGGIKG